MNEFIDFRTFLKKYSYIISVFMILWIMVSTSDFRWMYALGLLLAVESMRSLRLDLKKNTYSTAKAIIALRVVTVSLFFLFIYMANDGSIFGMSSDDLDQRYPYLVRGLVPIWIVSIIESVLKMKRFIKKDEGVDL